MKRKMGIRNALSSFFVLLVILWIAHHTSVYIHEWTHSTVAWLTGYKNSPFAIHYGSDWLTLWDIDEAVSYEQLLADRKLGVMAAIAITPLLLQAVLFLVGLRWLQRTYLNRWIFAFVYWFTLLEICEVFSYIPIRTFTQHGDVYHFLYATGISPWFIAIPGTLFAFWGVHRMLVREAPYACSVLAINSKTAKWAFLSANILLFFGYYGAVGFMTPYCIDQRLSFISCVFIPFVFIYCWLKQNPKLHCP